MGGVRHFLSYLHLYGSATGCTSMEAAHNTRHWRMVPCTKLNYIIGVKLIPGY